MRRRDQFSIVCPQTRCSMPWSAGAIWAEWAQKRSPAVVSQGGRRGASRHGCQWGRWTRRIAGRQRPGRRQWRRGRRRRAAHLLNEEVSDAPRPAPASLDMTLVVPATRTPSRQLPRMIWWPSAVALCAVRCVGLWPVGRPVKARRGDFPWCCKAFLTQSSRVQESTSHAAVSSMLSGIFVVLWTIQVARILCTLNRLSSKCRNPGSSLGGWRGACQCWGCAGRRD